jgi:hypothetical protein
MPKRAALANESKGALYTIDQQIQYPSFGPIEIYSAGIPCAAPPPCKLSLPNANLAALSRFFTRVNIIKYQ